MGTRRNDVLSTYCPTKGTTIRVRFIQTFKSHNILYIHYQNVSREGNEEVIKNKISTA